MNNFVISSHASQAMLEVAGTERANLSRPGDDAWPSPGEWPPQSFDLWTRVNVGELYPQPVSPLTWSGITTVVNNWIRHSLADVHSERLRIQWVKRFYGRVYFNEGALAHVISQEYGLPASFIEANDAALGSRGLRRGDAGFRPLQFLRRLPVVLRLALGRWGSDRRLKAYFPQIDQWIADFLEQGLDELSDSELWTEASNTWAERTRPVVTLHIMTSNSAMGTFALLTRLLDRWFGRKELAHDLVSGLSGVYVAEMAPALWEMARMLRDLGLAGVVLDNTPGVGLERLRLAPNARPIIEKLDSFLRRHGHRCASGGDSLYPRWLEEPEQVIEMLAGYLRAGDQRNPLEAEARQRQRREDAVRWVEANLNPIRLVIFRRVLARAQDAVRLRDNGKHYSTQIAFPFARIYRSLGRRWSERGWLQRPDDFFFLTHNEIETIIRAGDPAALRHDLLTLVSERRKAFDHWFGIEAPEVIGADGRPITAPSADDAAGITLRGIPASGGTARGTARIIDNPHEANRLQAGDILVTRATDPGWTPVFPLLAGLVLEVGGQLSHGAIVAREYGVPAVVNVQNATRRIKDGQTITVEGMTGHVYLDGHGL